MVDQLEFPGGGRKTGRGTTLLSFDRYPPLAEAGQILGLSGPALRKKFDRGDLPRKFLLRIGPRTLRVDMAGLLFHLKNQANTLSA